MINFRYHLVSLVAVFLALAIGIGAGSTVIKESVLDLTKRNLESTNRRLDDVERRNRQLEDALDDLEDRDDILDELGPEHFLRDRLLGLPILILRTDGAADDAYRGIERSLRAAGAQITGVVTLSEKLALTDPEAVQQMRVVLSSALAEPDILRGRLAGTLANLLHAAASVERPARSGSAVTVRPGAATPVSATALFDLLDRMEAAGFVDVADAAQGALDLSGLRVLVLSGPGAKLADENVVLPLLRELAASRVTAALAVEAVDPSDPELRPTFVPAVRSDRALHDMVSTVDDARSFVGWAAVVLSLADLGSGRVGHYGTAEGADGLLPSVRS